ncbi:hypothetical protein A6S26_27495 [Nostoc sp. ATCC 43529]|nr:hypothetical protein A6S26_27495 [Nostoc sp. ATCC 43529]
MSENIKKSASTIFLESRTQLRSELSHSDVFQRFTDEENGLKRVTIDGTTYLIAEGDLLLDEDELLLYANQRATQNRERESQNLLASAGMGFLGITDLRGLIGVTDGSGKIVRWAEGLKLTYCVLKQTFTSDQRYNTVKENMKLATQDWSVTCGVQFEYLEALDDSPGLNRAGVIFTVREIDARGAFIASAFFPNDPPSRRRVLVDGSYFDPSLRFNRVGVLRHELGHVLGFRHEHIRSGAPPACQGEPLGGDTPLTEYDPQSVMHYFCGGRGSAELAITELDRIGSQQVYGPSFGRFTFVQ